QLGRDLAGGHPAVAALVLGTGPPALGFGVLAFSGLAFSGLALVGLRHADHLFALPAAPSSRRSACSTVCARTSSGSPSNFCSSASQVVPVATANHTVPGSLPSCGSGPPAPVTATLTVASMSFPTPAAIASAAVRQTTGPSGTSRTWCLTCR